MEVIFAFALLLLAGAIVVLFAMLGELASRVPDPGRRDRTVLPLEGARVGHTPATWPDELSAIAATTERTVVLVLSTVCATCEDVARQLAADIGRDDVDDLALVVSCEQSPTGEEFLARHGLQRLPAYIDPGGHWAKSELGVAVSPTAVVLRGRQLAAALVFQDLTALRTEIARDREVAR